MNAKRGRAGRLAMIGALFGLVAALVAPHLGEVTAGPGDTDPVETTDPAEAATSPETSVVETTPTTEVEATTPVEDTTPETTADVTDSTEPAVESTVPEPTGPFPTVAPAPKPEAAPDTTEPDGTVGPAGPGDTYDVTVTGECRAGYELWISVTNLSTADARVSVGRDSMDLPASGTWELPWPMLDGDPPSPDPAPKWDAVRLDTLEIFEQGTLSIPADCPPANVPSAPQNFATTPGNGHVNLVWAAPATDGGSPITDYTIEYNPYPIEPSGGWTTVSDGVGTGTAFDVTGLTNGTTYLFRLTAVNANGPGPWVEGKDTPNVVPNAPTNVLVVPTMVIGQLRVSWTAPTIGHPLNDYVVQRSADAVTYVTIRIQSETSLLDSNMTPGRRYYYRVLARNGVGAGPVSLVGSGIPRGVPSAPRLLTATPLNSAVRLNWQVPLFLNGLPITDYVIQRSPHGANTWYSIPHTASTATTFTVTGLTNGRTYDFRVFAKNALGLSATPSRVATATPRTVPTGPRLLTVNPTSAGGQLRLSWQTPASNGGAAITDYIIQRSPDGVSGWFTIPDGTSIATAYTVTGLTNGRRYYFRVFAKNIAGQGASSSIANGIPGLPSAPRSLTAVPTNLSGQVRLSWTSPVANGGSTITDYVIQRSPNGSTWSTIPDGVNRNTTFTVTGLSNGVRYYFRVFARNASGQSPASNVANAVPRTVPSPPSFFSVDSDFDWFYFFWGTPASTGGSPITGYLIQGLNSSNVWVNVGVADPSWRDAFLSAPGFGCGTFRIAAMNAAGRSAFVGPRTSCFP